MAGKPPDPRRKTTIEIPLHSIRKYMPGSGPPPPRISLVPPRDSTAYIIDQFVLPTDKDMTESSRRLIHYHIGFTDLPAVKMLIPCHKVLDYVSPRELEDWEYGNLERKEEERARRLAEKQRAGPTKKKPGRPPKVPMKDVDMELNSTDDALVLAEQVAGPSLSTPQKRKPGRAPEEEVEDSNMESDDAAIHRQLQGGVESEGMAFEEDLEPDSESVDQLVPQHDTPTTETPSRASSLAQPVQDSFAVSPAVAGVGAVVPVTAPAPTLPPSNAPAPGRIHPAWAHVFGQQTRRQEAPDIHAGNGHVEQNGTILLKALPSKPSTSVATPGSAFKATNGFRASSSRLTTPGAGAGPAVTSNSSASKRKGQPNGKSPSPEKQPKAKKQKTKQEEEPVADEWEVKELLDDQWFVEQGLKVHKYLVLWEGDWPEDQNPTWEPAENVQDDSLLRKFQKKKKAGLLKPPKRTQKTHPQYLAGVKYSSVAEAFEAGIDDHTGPAATGIDSDTDLPEETFLVTENVGDITANGTKSAAAPTFGSFDNLLTRYNQTFPRG